MPCTLFTVKPLLALVPLLCVANYLITCGPAAWRAATRKGGTTVMVGAPGLDDPFTYPIPAFLAISEKKLVGSLLGSCNSLRDIPRLIALMQNGQLDLASLITARRGLDEINQAFDDIRTTTGIRTVIDF